MSQKLSPITIALAAAALFGASVPAAKFLLAGISPTLLAGLLYLGAGFGLGCFWLTKKFLLKHKQEAKLKLTDLPALFGAIAFGGIIGPLLLMFGLYHTSASLASLLLNIEGVLTVLIAWIIFKENFDYKIALGMIAIVSGSLILCWNATGDFSLTWGALYIIGACLCWAIDNNFTRKISAADPTQIAIIKGLVAGTVNCLIASFIDTQKPSLIVIISSCLVGIFCYGFSLSLFIKALRELGTARSSAYFSIAPFIGAALSIAFLHEPLTIKFMISGALMAIGVWLHISEVHEHMHKHEYLEHEHMHVHDEHHQHEHDHSISTTEPHNHMHKHFPIKHSHPHYPDIHHRHEH